MELTSENYFEYKNDENGVPVLSSSFLKGGAPVRAGNPERLEVSYQGRLESTTTNAMRFGSLVHAFAEDRERFVFEPEWEMSDSIRSIADGMIGTLRNSDTTIGDSPRNHERLFHTVCEEISWGMSWKENTRMSKFIDAAHLYWMFCLESEGKIVVTGNEVEKMAGVIKGIETAGLRTPLLDNREDSGVETHRELPIKFSLMGYPCKALLDNLEIDHNTKIATITDLKTTSWPIENFVGGYTYRTDEHNTAQKVSTQGDYVKYMYYFQEFFYKEGVICWLNDNDLVGYDVKFQFGVVETSEPFLAKMIKPNSQWMAIARHEYTETMKNVGLWMDNCKYLEF